MITECPWRTLNFKNWESVTEYPFYLWNRKSQNVPLTLKTKPKTSCFSSSCLQELRQIQTLHLIHRHSNQSTTKEFPWQPRIQKAKMTKPMLIKQTRTNLVVLLLKSPRRHGLPYWLQHCSCHGNIFCEKQIISDYFVLIL